MSSARFGPPSAKIGMCLSSSSGSPASSCMVSAKIVRSEFALSLSVLKGKVPAFQETGDSAVFRDLCSVVESGTVAFEEEEQKKP